MVLGKSTLAKIIMGIEKQDSGQVILDGKDISKKKIDERAKLGIAFAFQQPVKFKGITVYDLLKLSAKKEITRKEACEILSKVGLCAKEYVDREVNGSLSGGELKRIEIATVAVRDSKLTIFDEPEAGIDLWSFNSLIKVFEEIRKDIPLERIGETSDISNTAFFLASEEANYITGQVISPNGGWVI